MAYMLLGSLFIGIGAQATTVREVQTLSMPVTMGQVMIFFLASYAVNRPGQPAEIAAMLFPWSSPFAMIARAAQSRSEEHTSELQSLMRNSYAVFCLKKKNN